MGVPGGEGGGSGGCPTAVGRSSGPAPLEMRGLSGRAPPADEEFVGAVGSCGVTRWGIVWAVVTDAPR